MSEVRSFGVSSIKMGDIEVDGGVSLTMAVLGDGNTLEGTATFTKEADEEKPFYAEEKDDPIEIILKKGATTVEFAIVDFTPATMVKVLGGTTNLLKWEAPDVAPDIEQSLEITTSRGVVITICRAKIKGSVDWPLSKDDLGKIKVKAIVLSPKKAGVKSVTVDTTGYTG